MENSTNLLRRNFFSSKLFFSKTYFLERTLVSQARELFIMGWVMILVPGGSSLLSSLLVMISMEGMEALSGGCLEAACRYVARGVKLEVLPGLTVTEERLELELDRGCWCVILVRLTPPDIVSSRTALSALVLTLGVPRTDRPSQKYKQEKSYRCVRVETFKLSRIISLCKVVYYRGVFFSTF